MEVLLNTLVVLLLLAPVRSIEAPYKCREFTIDKCDQGDCAFQPINEVSSIELCQLWCTDVLPEKCKSFAYSHTNNICTIYDCPLTAWIPSCQLIGGTKSPKVDECDIVDDDCSAFRSGDCEYIGNVINEQDVTSASRCQSACILQGQCEYFVYDGQTKTCKLYDEKARRCDTTVGTPYPPVEECAEPPPDRVELLVYVVDNKTQEFLSDARVAFQDDHTNAGYNVTDANGLTTLGIFEVDTQVKLTVHIDMYTNVSKDVTISGASSQQVETIHLTQIQPLLTVTTANSLDNSALPYCNISYFNLDNLDDQGSGVTDTNGIWAAGQFPPTTSLTISASKEGFVTTNVTITMGNDDKDQLLSLSPVPEEGELRFVMNWNADPKDLDLHVDQENVDTSDVCNVFYGHKECPGANLDVDNTSGGENGAETITLTEPGNNIYLVYVYDFTGDTNHPLTTTGARVALYGPTEGQSRLINVPETSEVYSRYWVVGCLDGREGFDSFQEINQLRATTPTMTMCHF